MYSDAIKEYGSKNSDGKYSVTYGILFEKTANTRRSTFRVQSIHSYAILVEALNGTLRAAKRQKKVRP